MTPSNKLKQRTPARGHGRQAFLAKRGEIRQALKNGYTAKEVWALLHKKGAMPVQYRTFIDYVNRYLKEGGDSGKSRPRHTKTPPQPSPRESQAEAKPRRSQFTRRFEFNAKGKRKEDLI